MRGMLFTEAGTEFTEFGTECAHADCKYGAPAHPLRRKHAHISTIAAEPDTTGRQILGRLLRHADHVVSTGVADMRAGHASLNTIFYVSSEGML